ncbi:hypothetical protein GQ457_06G005180 [Hibiscus cannabinus]
MKGVRGKGKGKGERGKRGILRMSPAAVDSARSETEIKFSVSGNLTDSTHAFEVLEFPLCPPFLSRRQPDLRFLKRERERELRGIFGSGRGGKIFSL